MKTGLLSVLMLILVTFSGYAQAVSGKEIFSGNCQACHSIGGGDIVGPDLAGLIERRQTDWIKSFITNSQKMVAAGDEEAVAVFTKYNKIAMPAHNFNEEELTSLISYIDEAGKEAVAAKAEAAATPAPATAQQEVALAETDNGWNIYVNMILALLGITAALLTVMAVYLSRYLKSF
ncbi:cytochrome c [Cesiribacter sp. SM1]|uniref:c-type cytochrome n=1 Tax=Cesiribacter sp. SM1 TaxID=2861196 RepID=UPI001CD5AF70|nr:cytochrome c [Cesiribacter sp. SM1]